MHVEGSAGRDPALPPTQSLTHQAIAAVSTTSAQGLHSPVLTHGAFPIVDGVVTSFDRIESVTLASCVCRPSSACVSKPILGHPF